MLDNPVIQNLSLSHAALPSAVGLHLTAHLDASEKESTFTEVKGTGMTVPPSADKLRKQLRLSQHGEQLARGLALEFGSEIFYHLFWSRQFAVNEEGVQALKRATDACPAFFREVEQAADNLAEWTLTSISLAWKQVLSLLRPIEVEQDGSVVAECLERYGPTFLGLLSGGSYNISEVFAFEFENRTFLTRYASYLGRDGKAGFESLAASPEVNFKVLLALTEKFLTFGRTFPQLLTIIPLSKQTELLSFVPVLGESFPVVLEAFGRYLFELSAEELNDIRRIALRLIPFSPSEGPHTPMGREVFEFIRNEASSLDHVTHEAPHVSAALVDHFRLNGLLLAIVFADEFIRLESVLKMHDNFHATSAVVRNLVARLEGDLPKALDVLEQAWWGHDSISASVCADLIDEGTEFTTAAARLVGGYASPLYLTVPEQLLATHTPFLIDCIRLCGRNAFHIYRSMQDCGPGEAACWEELLEEFGVLLWPLAEKSGVWAPITARHHRAFMTEVFARCGPDAPSLLSSLSFQEWTMAVASPLIDRYGSAAGNEHFFRKRHRAFSPGVREEFLRQETRDIFGIHNFHRYVEFLPRNGILDSCLSESLQIVENGGAPRPLLLVIHAASDHNNAFRSNGLPRMLRELKENYAIVPIEARTIDEACDRAEALCSRFGKKSTILHFGAHGTPDGMILSYSANGPPSEEPHIERFTVEHAAAMSRLGGLLEPEGLAVWTGCGLASGGVERQNFATVASRHLPHVTTFASRWADSFLGYERSNSGKIVRPRFGKGHEGVFVSPPSD